MLVQTERLSVRKLERKDSVLLAKWLSDERLLEFYEGRDKPFSLSMTEKKFYDRNSETTRCIIAYDDNPIGYLQFYEISVKERELYGYADGTVFGMDQFIGEPGLWNLGLGEKVIGAVSSYLLSRADRLVMDPMAKNERAIRCYEKCGFQKVKLLSKHLFHENAYRDCWLMSKSSNA
ncbi:GNAT family N-acetyltransferase [Metabacillus idriensis]|uniref:GNAT family N-acetyltransferase n=1 Tax=Metabacillus idriensis TaxID=324768 RepID=UPI003D2E0CA6